MWCLSPSCLLLCCIRCTAHSNPTTRNLTCFGANSAKETCETTHGACCVNYHFISKNGQIRFGGCLNEIRNCQFGCGFASVIPVDTNDDFRRLDDIFMCSCGRSYCNADSNQSMNASYQYQKWLVSNDTLWPRSLGQTDEVERTPIYTGFAETTQPSHIAGGIDMAVICAIIGFLGVAALLFGVFVGVFEHVTEQHERRRQAQQHVGPLTYLDGEDSRKERHRMAERQQADAGVHSVDADNTGSEHDDTDSGGG